MSDGQSLPQQQVINNKVFALLSYLAVLCVIPLLLKTENPFVYQHAKQGLVLFIIQVIVFLSSIVLPWVFVGFFYCITAVLSALGIIDSLKGRFVRMPVIADVADKIVL